MAMSQAQEQVFTANIPLAIWVARRYSYGHGTLSLDDRIQAARIGLWKAVLRHDPTKAKLSTFAVRVMINEIVRAGQHEQPTGAVRIEDVQAVLAERADGPEASLLRREENASLSAYAARIPRQRKHKGATWTASDVAALIDQGNRPSQVARLLGVSRERISQVVAAIRAARLEEEGR